MKTIILFFALLCGAFADTLFTPEKIELKHEDLYLSKPLPVTVALIVSNSVFRSSGIGYISVTQLEPTARNFVFGGKNGPLATLSYYTEPQGTYARSIVLKSRRQPIVVQRGEDWLVMILADY